MSPLRQALQKYLAIRRSLGFQLRVPAVCLRGFVTFLEEAGATHITTELALEWARRPTRVRPATWGRRLAMVRRFARWHRAADPRTEVPPDDLLPCRQPRKPPYIYTDDEIDRLIRAARELPSPRGLRALSYATLFGLLAATGMRISEALNLDRADIDPDRGVLTIRLTKFGKSRLVPLHASACEALNEYARQRDRILPASLSRGFFLSEAGRRISRQSARYTFAKVSRRIGLRGPAPRYRCGRGPRLHDMRHRFAARTLIDWYRVGLDVEREMPRLSAYLGHARVNDTYWYLEAVPELLQLATRRLMERGRESES